jgi:hypothetical protein
MIGAMPDHVELDHVALAAEHAADNLDRYVGDLGGRWAGGGVGDFYWGQVRFANEMRVELLEPTTEDPANFLRRFLDRNGPGAHHLTFKVPDLAAQLERVRAAGHDPLHVDLSDDSWQEAFLHPKASWGLVIQLAYARGDEPQPEDAGLPPGRNGAPATLERLVHLVSDLDGAQQLFVDLLDGTVEGGGVDHVGRWSELAWPGPGRLRLLEPTDERARHWLGGRRGRFHHLHFSLAEPAAVTGARPRGDGSWAVAPEHNQGVRLHLSGPAPDHAG